MFPKGIYELAGHYQYESVRAAFARHIWETADHDMTLLNDEKAAAQVREFVSGQREDFDDHYESLMIERSKDHLPYWQYKEEEAPPILWMLMRYSGILLKSGEGEAMEWFGQWLSARYGWPGPMKREELGKVIGYLMTCIDLNKSPEYFCVGSIYVPGRIAKVLLKYPFKNLTVGGVTEQVLARGDNPEDPLYNRSYDNSKVMMAYADMSLHWAESMGELSGKEFACVEIGQDWSECHKQLNAFIPLLDNRNPAPGAKGEFYKLLYHWKSRHCTAWTAF